LPGKITDLKSAGCNYLIQNNKAVLFTDAKELVENFGLAIKNNRNDRKNCLH